MYVHISVHEVTDGTLAVSHTFHIFRWPSFRKDLGIDGTKDMDQGPFLGAGGPRCPNSLFQSHVYIGEMQNFAGEIRPLPRFEGFAPKISRLRGFVSEVRGADDQLLPAGDRIRRRFSVDCLGESSTKGQKQETYCWWKKSCTSWFYRYQVVQDFNHQQYVVRRFDFKVICTFRRDVLPTFSEPHDKFDILQSSQGTAKKMLELRLIQRTSYMQILNSPWKMVDGSLLQH